MLKPLSLTLLLTVALLVEGQSSTTDTVSSSTSSSILQQSSSSSEAVAAIAATSSATTTPEATSSRTSSSSLADADAVAASPPTTMSSSLSSTLTSTMTSTLSSTLSSSLASTLSSTHSSTLSSTLSPTSSSLTPTSTTNSPGCTGCNFCASALLLSWTLNPKLKPTPYITHIEVYDPSASTTATITTTADLDLDNNPTLSQQLSLYSASIAAGKTHTSITASGQLEAVFPTPYLLFQPNYAWAGELQMDGTCATASSTAVPAPEPTALKVSALPTPADGVEDPFGWYYDLTAVVVDGSLPEYGGGGAQVPLQSCKPNCDNTAFEGFKSTEVRYSIVQPTPQLSVAFVTACVRSTLGVEGMGECVDGAKAGAGGGGGSAGATPTPTPTAGGGGSASGVGNSSGGGGGGGGGGASNTATPGSGGGGSSNTATAGNGNGNNGGSGGSNDKITTVDNSGNTIIVAAPPAPTPADILYITTNAQGATVVATGDPPPPGGSGSGSDPNNPNPGSGSSGSGESVPEGLQITLTNSLGETVVIQGAHLAPTPNPTDGTNPNAGGGTALTVTNEVGELVIIQGGVTGTLSVTTGADGTVQTVLVAGTVTQSGWQAGETISGGGGAVGTVTAEPTGVQNGGMRVGVEVAVTSGLVLIGLLACLWL